MKIKEYKNGTIKMTAENKDDSSRLTAFLSRVAGIDSNFDKLHQGKLENQPEKPRNERVDEFDNYFKAAAKTVVKHQVASTSLLQRKFRIGYFRAKRLMDQLMSADIVSVSFKNSPLAVLVKSETELEYIFEKLDIIGQIEESSSWDNRF